ncbi:MAG: CPBP family intramembrane metalloprotease [Anaerolineales bacterium]|nr:CPBP family intramembrane metalloprotease [Anaerolineales bacterium]
METTLISLAAIILLSAAILITGIKKQPGIGILIAAVVIGLWLLIGKRSFADLGLSAPDDWLRTILISLGAGLLLAFASATFFEPLAERVTGEEIDYSLFKNLRGNPGMLATWILVGWMLAAFLEEIIFRGFLMKETIRLVDIDRLGPPVVLLMSSILFGIAHWYQGWSGALSTALVGLFLGNLLIWFGYNLWTPILTHGVINTVGLIFLYTGADARLKELFWSEKKAGKKK